MIEPYLELWAAALQVAIEDVRSSRKDRDAKNSVVWIQSDSNSPRSFLWVCDMLVAGRHRVRKLCRVDNSVNLSDTART